jgi:hypothetical protein
MKKLYEFMPTVKKIREKIVMSVCLLLSSLAYGVSNFLPYPVLYQLFAVILLTVAVLMIVRYLLRDYVYAIHADENGEACELVIVEVVGKKQTVVCRLPLSDVKGMLPRAAFLKSEDRRQAEIYRYVSEMLPENAFYLEISSEEKRFYVEILADRTLEGLISSRHEQDLTKM